MGDFVSVVVPIYKVEKYLSKCVDSLLNQTYDNYEIILVDDGSPDRCPELCDKYAEKYEKVRVYHKPNGGLSDARNYGTHRAKGDWIVFVDSDDYVESSYISDLWTLAQKYNADIAAAACLHEYENGEIIGKKAKFHSFCVSGKEAIWGIYGGCFPIGWAAWNKIYNKRLLLNNPFPDGYHEDMASLYRKLFQCNKVAIGDFNQNYHYIERDNSILSSLSKKHFRIFDICEEFKLFVTQELLEKLLIPIVYAKAVILLLRRCKNINIDDYNKVFYMHRHMFRKNAIKVVFAPKIRIKFKILFLLLTTYPKLFRNFTNYAK